MTLFRFGGLRRVFLLTCDVCGVQEEFAVHPSHFDAAMLEHDECQSDPRGNLVLVETRELQASEVAK